MWDQPGSCGPAHHGTLRCPGRYELSHHAPRGHTPFSAWWRGPLVDTARDLTSPGSRLRPCPALKNSMTQVRGVGPSPHLGDKVIPSSTLPPSGCLWEGFCRTRGHCLLHLALPSLWQQMGKPGGPGEVCGQGVGSCKLLSGSAPACRVVSLGCSWSGSTQRIQVWPHGASETRCDQNSLSRSRAAMCGCPWEGSHTHRHEVLAGHG